jgi:hypothetical protein
MDAIIYGHYTFLHVNLNEIEFNNGWTNSYNMNQLVVGSLVAMRLEMSGKCIDLFVAKIH